MTATSTRRNTFFVDCPDSNEYWMELADYFVAFGADIARMDNGAPWLHVSTGFFCYAQGLTDGQKISLRRLVALATRTLEQERHRATREERDFRPERLALRVKVRYEDRMAS